MTNEELRIYSDYLVSLGQIHIIILNPIDPEYNPADPFETSFVHELEDIYRIGFHDDKVIVMCFPKGQFTCVERKYIANYIKHK